MSTNLVKETLPQFIGAPNMLHWYMNEEGATAILTIDERTCRYLPKLNNYQFALVTFDSGVCIGMNADGLEYLNENGWQVAYLAPHELKLEQDNQTGMPLTVMVVRSSDGQVTAEDIVELPDEFVEDLGLAIEELRKKDVNAYQFRESVKWLQELYSRDEMFVGCA